MTHKHKKDNYNKAFTIGIIINSLYIIIELFYGISSNSIALIADAGHNFGDVLSLGLAWGAAILAKKTIAKNKTYGYRKTTIMAALFNAIILMIVIGGITIESIQRISHPNPVPGNIIMIVAGIGIVINLLTALLFIKGRKEDINIKGAFLHMAGDAATSAAVVIGGLIIINTGYYFIDPLLSLIIVAIIFISTWSLLKVSTNMALDAVPEGINTKEVNDYILSFPDVENIHDLHIWSLSTTEIALSAHVIKSNSNTDDKFLETMVSELHDKFNIHHSTIQIEKNKLMIETHCNCDNKN